MSCWKRVLRYGSRWSLDNLICADVLTMSHVQLQRCNYSELGYATSVKYTLEFEVLNVDKIMQKILLIIFILITSLNDNIWDRMG